MSQRNIVSDNIIINKMTNMLLIINQLTTLKRHTRILGILNNVWC